MTSDAMEVLLKAARQRAGLSQGELAARVGVSRQAISAIETGRAAPTMPVALRCAQALGVRADELFRLVDSLPRIEADLVDVPDLPGNGPYRVQVADIGGRIIARPLIGASGMLVSLPRANGLLRPQRSGAARVTVELFDDPDDLERTVVLVGCDPSMSVLADHVRRRHPGADLIFQASNSRAALEAVARNEAHVAGLHLLDPATGEYNRPFARERLGNDVHLVTFAIWEQGLMVSAGNPRGIQDVPGLTRSGVRVINREQGSGARALLDAELQSAGVESREVEGYDTVVQSHLAAAEAVSAGLADAAIGARVAAQALGLDFVLLAEERYDLAIPDRYYRLESVQALLETLTSPLFRREIDAFGGYDVAPMGAIVPAA
jgi:molybdate-binding protein/DNA-binding XRE family transcriptional regulator